ncbi:MAG TPA: DUF885 domain-containing protein [Acidimicrobiales bacterium]
MDERIGSLADQLVAIRFQEEPLRAALLGLPDGDLALGDLSRNAEVALLAAYSSLAAAATSLHDRVAGEGATLDEIELVTLDHVRFSAANRVDELGVRGVEFTISDFHNSPLSMLLGVLYQLPLDTADRKVGHLRRLASMPAYLEGAAERHRDGAAGGRVPTARGVRAALAQIDTVLEKSDLSGLRRSLDDGDDNFAADQERVIELSVRPALEQYRAFLTREALPVGRSDDQPGLRWLPDGDEAYHLLVRAHTSGARTPEELHAMGIAITERLHEEFAEVGARLWGTSDVTEIHSRLRSDPDLRYADSDEIVVSAIDIVRRAELAAPEWFGVVPSVPCAVEPVPDALADGSAPAYYFRGALDGSRRGTYFINATKPHERYRHMAEAIAFHEAVPGHHFQLAIAQERKGGHVVFAVFGDTASAEGWGLYAERLADEMGLYSGDLTRLGMLSTDAWRAARLVVDTGIHAMGWSRQKAIDWMATHVPMSQVEINSEVDRYVVNPAQALSYMVGRLELEALRRESAARLGEKFSVRDFHDVVLRTGPVALPALAAAVNRWIVAGGRAPL